MTRSRTQIARLAGAVLALFLALGAATAVPARAAEQATPAPLPTWAEATPLIVEAFGFPMGWQQLQPAGTTRTIAATAISRLFPGAAAHLPITQEQALFRLAGGSARFTLVPSDLTLGSNGLTDCGEQFDCFKLRIEAEFTLQRPPRLDAGAAPAWCAGPPGNVLGVSCMADYRMVPRGPGPSVTWTLIGETLPREDFVLKQALKLITLQVVEPTLQRCSVAFNAARGTLESNTGTYRLRKSEAEKLIEVLTKQRAALAPYQKVEGAAEALAWTYVLLPVEVALTILGHPGKTALFTNGCKLAKTATVPLKATNVARHVRASSLKPLPGYVGGKAFKNRQAKLPLGRKYKEFDVDPKPASGTSRNAERIVVDVDNPRRAWYTPDHYETFIPIGG
jgi:hypothetical protein